MARARSSRVSGRRARRQATGYLAANPGQYHHPGLLGSFGGYGHGGGGGCCKKDDDKGRAGREEFHEQETTSKLTLFANWQFCKFIEEKVLPSKSRGSKLRPKLRGFFFFFFFSEFMGATFAKLSFGQQRFHETRPGRSTRSWPSASRCSPWCRRS